MNSIIENIKERRSVRTFDGRLIDDDTKENRCRKKKQEI